MSVTRRQMAEAKARYPKQRVTIRCCCDHGTGFSADPGDYWMHGEDEPLGPCEDCGEEFQLGYTRSEWVPV